MRMAKLITSTAMMTISLTAAATAQEFLSDRGVIIVSDSDRTGDNGLFLYHGGFNGTPQSLIAGITTGGAAFSGDVSLTGVLYDADSPQVTINDGLSVSGYSQLNSGLDVDGVTTINTRANSQDTRIGGVNNSTSILSDTVTINAPEKVNIFAGGDLGNSGADQSILLVALRDVRIVADDDLEFSASDDMDVRVQDSIEFFAGDDFDVDANDRVQFNASRFYVNTGGEGVYAGLRIAGNNEQSRLVADENGLFREVNEDEFSTVGRTAALVVTSPTTQQMHGLVVQETKTTLSGGTNSSSLTLDDRGATFSNPANGQPIQVHGVADGTAPFDAVNVRQLYSGLAAVLAAAPEIRLEPGKSGFGIGVGSYGGYQAIGMGFGHMYDNGAVVQSSLSTGQHSEIAARASVSWTW